MNRFKFKRKMKKFAPKVDADSKRKAEFAGQILSNPLMTEIFDRMEKSCIDRWRITDPSDVETREIYYTELRMLLSIKTSIQSYLTAVQNKEDLTRYHRQAKAAV